MAGVFTSTVLGEMSDKVDLWETPPSALRDTFLRQVYSDGVVDLLGDWRFGEWGRGDGRLSWEDRAGD